MKFIIDLWMDEEFENEEEEFKAKKEYIEEQLNFTCGQVTVKRYKEKEGVK